MDSPGRHLKQERELRNLSFEEVSKSTRIKEHFLKAMEEDRYDLCPPPFYVKGFLMNYARYLGLDPNDIILKYRELIVASDPSPGGRLSKKSRRRRFNFIQGFKPELNQERPFAF